MLDTTVASPVDATRLCSQCGRLFPLESFRLRTSDGRYRDGRCRSCHNAAERRRKRTARQRELRTAISRIRAARSAHRAVALVNGIVNRLGGLDKSVTLWRELLESGNPLVGLRAFDGLLKVMQATERLNVRRAELREQRRKRQRAEAEDPVPKDAIREDWLEAERIEREMLASSP